MGAHELAFVGLAGSGLGTALSVPMVWPRAGRPMDVRLLGSAMLLMSGIAALISLRLAGLAPASATVGHAINVLGIFAFAALVLYVRHSTAATITLSTMVWHVLPAAGYILFVATRGVLGLDTRVPFAWMLPLVLGSTVLSAVTLWSSGGPRTVGVVPAQWIVGFAIAVNIAQIVRMQFGHIAPVRALVPIVLSAGFLGLTMLLVRRALVTATPRYERSGLEDAVGAELVTRVEAALVRDRLFARADLTLADLAAAAAATPHQVSEALNRVAGVSFHDFVNRRRVDDVKSQLLDPSSERFTIEGIGLSAGFGSRSALYAAFRRFEGMTPTAFRASPQRHRGAAGGV